jgi:2-dehydro-3-deoxygluconokinase
VAVVVALGEALVELAAVGGPLEEAREFRRGFGGDTSNFAVAAARLGAEVAYVTRVGDDAFGRALLRMWTEEGVDVSHVRVGAGEPTGIYFLAPDGAGQFTYYRTGSAASRLGPEDVPQVLLRSARLLHTSGITQAISPSAREAARTAVEAAKEFGVRVSYDVNARPKLASAAELRAWVGETLPLVDLAFLSAEDARFLFGEAGEDAVLDRLLELGARVAVLKLGERGCRVATRDGEGVAAPGWPVASVDPTGAGDAFDAAFAVEWLAGRPLAEAAKFANAVGALSTTGLGATAALPTRGQVERFLARPGEAP